MALEAAPRRGDVWWVIFDPSLGGETRKTRLAVIVNNDSANLHLNRTQAIPLTSNIARLYPPEAFVTLNGKRRKAMADHITAISKLRLKSQIGRLSGEDMAAVDQAIRTQLAL